MKTWAGLALAILVLLVTVPGIAVGGLVSADTVQVSLSPAVITVPPDSVFKVYVRLDSLGPPINGYETVVRWDSDLLQFVSVQAESLFTPYNQWWLTEPGADSVFISHVILQSGITVTGPGPLSSISLRALDYGHAQVTFDYIEFYRAGFIIPSRVTHEADVYVVDPGSGVPGGAGERGGARGLRLVPNPLRPESILLAELPAGSGGVIGVFDAQGRALRHLALPASSDRAVSVQVPLSDLLDPARARAGPYFFVLRTSLGRMATRAVLLH